MRLFSLCLLFFIFPLLLPAQPINNLVPNPGFEKRSKCPKALGQIDRVDDWNSPNGGTPDYFSECFQKNYQSVSVPRNYFGIQGAWDGKAYAGIYAGEQEMEYLQVQLTEPLEAGEKYCLRFFASPPSWEGEQFPALKAMLGVGALQESDWGRLEGKGEVLDLDYELDGQIGSWVILSATIMAKGGEDNLIIGYFGQTDGKGYTYIDGVGLYPYDSPGSCAWEYFSGDPEEDTYNFVPNPGFELKYACPEAREQFELAVGWRVMENTPDFFHTCGSGTAAVPNNQLGFQEPYEGSGYGGFWCLLISRRDYREFISMKLREPLKKGEVYCLSMKVSLSDITTHALGDLQMLPARRPERDASTLPSDDPRLVFLTDSTAGILDDREGWTNISALFVANGDEKYLTIGNFRKNDDPKLVRDRPDKPRKPGQLIFQSSNCYYYVDDVSLSLQESPISECPVTQVPQVVADPDLPNWSFQTGVPQVDPAAREEEPVADWKAGDTLVLEHFLFAFDAADLAPEATPILDTLGAYLGRHPELRVAITGHTDDQGSEAYNLRLSRERAGSVMAYLEALGIAEKRIETEGKGESEPLVPNDSEGNRTSNRRVEIRFLEE